MTDEELKTAFAKGLLREPDEPFKVMLKLIPNNTPLALKLSNEWGQDPFVLSEMQRLEREEGAIAFLPSKDLLARQLWKRMQNDKLDADEYTKLAKLYADVMGFIQKTEAVTNVVVHQNKVMVVSDKGTDDEWEEKVRKQQADLASGNYKPAVQH